MERIVLMVDSMILREVCDERTKAITDRLDVASYEYQTLAKAVLMIEQTTISQEKMITIMHDTLMGDKENGKDGIFHKVENISSVIGTFKGAFIGVSYMFGGISFLAGVAYTVKELVG